MKLTLKEEVSVPDIIAGISACGVAVSVFYNWGFFLRADPSLISLLSLQDHFLGALIGGGSIGLGFLAGRIIASFMYQHDTPENNPLMNSDPWAKMPKVSKWLNPFDFVFLCLAILC